jgi:hypothetical protein
LNRFESELDLVFNSWLIDKPWVDGCLLLLVTYLEVCYCHSSYDMRLIYGCFARFVRCSPRARYTPQSRDMDWRGDDVYTLDGSRLKFGFLHLWLQLETIMHFTIVLVSIWFCILWRSPRHPSKTLVM